MFSQQEKAKTVQNKNTTITETTKPAVPSTMTESLTEILVDSNLYQLQIITAHCCKKNTWQKQFKEIFFFGSQFKRICWALVGKSQWLELEETAGYSIFSQKGREENAGAQLTSFFPPFYSIWNPRHYDSSTHLQDISSLLS